MKKFSLFFLTLLAGLTLAACGNQAAEKKEKISNCDNELDLIRFSEKCWARQN